MYSQETEICYSTLCTLQTKARPITLFEGHFDVVWRDEQSLIGDGETFNKDEGVTHTMDQYHHTFTDLDKAIQDASKMEQHQLALGWNDVVSHTHTC